MSDFYALGSCNECGLPVGRAFPCTSSGGLLPLKYYWHLSPLNGEAVNVDVFLMFGDAHPGLGEIGIVDYKGWPEALRHKVRP